MELFLLSCKDYEKIAYFQHIIGLTTVTDEIIQISRLSVIKFKVSSKSKDYHDTKKKKTCPRGKPRISHLDNKIICF